MKKLFRIIQSWFLPKCPDCKQGLLHHVYDEPTENFITYISVYECDHCLKKFV